MHIKENHHKPYIQLTKDKQNALGYVAFVVNEDNKILRCYRKISMEPTNIA